MADAATDPLPQLLTAEAALVCRPFAGAVALAAGACGRRRVAVPRGHLVRIGGVPLLDLIALTGDAPVEIGDADGFLAEELARAGEMALLVAARATAAELAAAIWACRSAATPTVVVASRASPPLALLDAGADLVVVDVAEHYAGPPLGVIAGAAALVAASGALTLSALFRADPGDRAAALRALTAAAGDPASGLAMPLPG